MTEPTAIFHLSLPVTSLAASLAFYQRCLGAQRGRDGDGWSDLILFGHQLTLHELPDQVLSREQQGVRHFGAIIDLAAFTALRERIASCCPELQPRCPPHDVGSPSEQHKLLLEDPDGHLLEIKAYRALATISTALDEAHAAARI